MREIPVTCLVVDDLDENLLAMSALLRTDGVEVLTARTGGEALELLLGHEVALAFLDVQMPEMDGFELAELMRGSARTRHVPIIFVTAGAHEQHRVFKGYDMGAVDFLYKPVDPHVLRSKADVFFELYRQRRRVAVELYERNETLQLMEMLTAVLGHDLRNPLNAMVGSAQLIHSVTTDDRVRTMASRILSSGKRMTNLISDLLDISRARVAGGIPLSPRPADLGAVIQAIAQEAGSAAPDRTIEVVTDGDLTGTWDADRMQQVAGNLIGNALQHGRREHPVRVRGASLHQDAVLLEVVNGGTIDAARLPHLFDPFKRQEMGDPAAGLGLGLYIVQQIVRAHGGSIEVSSENDATSFRVLLPRHIAAAARA
jgi:two-component system, sensor histidine kinase and response regulator